MGGMVWRFGGLERGMDVFKTRGNRTNYITTYAAKRCTDSSSQRHVNPQPATTTNTILTKKSSSGSSSSTSAAETGTGLRRRGRPCRDRSNRRRSRR